MKGCCTPQNPTPPCKPCAPCGEKSDATALAQKPAPPTVAPTSPPSKSCAPCGKKSDSSDPAQKPATSTAQQQQARAHENGLQQHPPIDENVAHQQAQQPHNENQQHQDEPSIPRPMMLAGATPIREPAPVKPEHQVSLIDLPHDKVRVEFLRHKIMFCIPFFT